MDGGREEGERRERERSRQQLWRITNAIVVDGILGCWLAERLQRGASGRDGASAAPLSFNYNTELRD